MPREEFVEKDRMITEAILDYQQMFKKGRKENVQKEKKPFIVRFLKEMNQLFFS